MPIPVSTLLSAFAALVAVLALVLLAGRAVRLTRTPAGRRLATSETLALDRSRRLSIVRCDGRELLLLTGGGTDTLIAWLPARPGGGGDAA